MYITSENILRYADVHIGLYNLEHIKINCSTFMVRVVDHNSTHISKMWGLVYRVMHVTLMCNYGPILYGIAIHYMLLAA